MLRFFRALGTGQKTCPKCGWDMTEAPPHNPPKWLSMWVCECRYAEAVQLPYAESITVTIGVSE
jgi:uncharacterized protein (DUF983 family)